MQLTKTVSALILASTAASFTIPANTTDGLYAVRLLDDGTEEHTRISDLPSQAGLAPNTHRAVKPRKMGWDTPACYAKEGAQDLDHRTTDAANAGLDTQLDGTVFQGYSLYSVSECVVAYVCNNGKRDFAYSRSDHDLACKLITAHCGAYKPGSATYRDDGSDVQKVYGYESYCTGMGKLSVPGGRSSQGDECRGLREPLT